jgi:undecaprenyl-diphosphatase
MNWFEALIIAIVEGITEFLPISSTGHMIIAKEVLGIQDSEFINLFIVNIQFGAIISVIILYWKRFFKSFNFYLKLLVAFLPAALVGITVASLIDRLLESPIVVSCALILGGILLLFVDRWFNEVDEKQEITYSRALKIGFFQIIAMIPGVSRSAASIIGGMIVKLNRRNAAEFSFFLAVPTMFAASAYKLFISYETLNRDHLEILIFGNIIALIVALIAIRSFIYYLTRHGFRIFGWYRIIAGIVILLLIMTGKISM